MDKDLERLHDAARSSLISRREDLIQTGESASTLKKTRKALSQLDWGVEQYADALDNLMSRGASADEIRTYIRSIEEKALKDFKLLADDSVHHRVQSRTGGDTLSKAKSTHVRNVVKRLEQKYGFKFSNSSGPGGNLTANGSLSNFAHKSDDRARGLELESGIGKNPDKSTTAHPRGNGGYAKDLTQADIADEKSLFKALDKRVGDQVADANTGFLTDAPRQQVIRDLTGDPLAYNPNATAEDVAKTKVKVQSLLQTDLPKVRSSYLTLTGGRAMFNFGMGGLMGFLTNDEAVDAAIKGDYATAVTKGAVDFAAGEIISQGVQRFVIPAVQRVVPVFANGLARLAPIGLALTALQGAASAPMYGGMTELTGAKTAP
jgi:hypothetical protein|tara:strand:+ start:54 stop:1181 length:1128 start_codon:yes stop_codon:yes gene_type:complete